jgi:hypothetical protein
MSTTTNTEYSINVPSQRVTEGAHHEWVITFPKSAQRDVVGREPLNSVIAIGPAASSQQHIHYLDALALVALVALVAELGFISSPDSGQVSNSTA